MQSILIVLDIVKTRNIQVTYFSDVPSYHRPDCLYMLKTFENLPQRINNVGTIDVHKLFAKDFIQKTPNGMNTYSLE